MSNRAQPPLVSVSVVSHGEAALVQALLDSLSKHEQADRLQLILTDNLGNDVPDFDAAHWPSLNILRNRRPQGFASNHNAAFRLARGTYFCVLNPDVLFVEPVFQPLSASLGAGRGHIAAALISDSEGTIQDSFRRLPSPLELFQRRALGQTPAPQIPSRPTILYPDWLAGIFLFMRNEVFSKIGGFDERYRLYFEDVDFCTRARLMGFIPFVDTGVRLQHNARRASRSEGRYLFWHAQSAVRFFASSVYRQARKSANTHA